MKLASLKVWVEVIQSSRKGRPLILGINGPQGCGKSTLARGLVQELGDGALAISIDDFYLTHPEQTTLASRFQSNPYLQQRGYPGTHDVKLGTETLEKLRNLKAGEEMRVPSYDKSRHAGKGDRREEGDWPLVRGPLKYILLEGWMLGFKPVGFGEVDPFLEPYQEWNGLVDAWIILEPENIEYVVPWRMEAEANARKSGREGMTDEEVRTYVEKFLPAYRTYLPPLLQPGSVKGPVLRLKVDVKRNLRLV